MPKTNAQLSVESLRIIGNYERQYRTLLEAKLQFLSVINELKMDRHAIAVVEDFSDYLVKKAQQNAKDLLEDGRPMAMMRGESASKTNSDRAKEFPL